MTDDRKPDRPAIVLTWAQIRVAALLLGGAAAGLALFYRTRSHLPLPGSEYPNDIARDSASWRDAPLIAVSTAGRPFRGSPAAPVTIVEFTDYGCPHCRRHATEVLPRLLEDYGDTIRYVIRHFPIPALTPNALNAADAVECAHLQGLAWEYREALLAEPDTLTDAVLRARAGAGGLNVSSFAECFETHTTRPVVERDILDGWEYGVTGTPTFFVNGRRFRGFRSWKELEHYVEFAMDETDSSTPD